MAYDKVVDSAVLNANLTTVADAIRAKGGTTGALPFPAGFIEAIAAIESGAGKQLKIAYEVFTPAEDVSTYTVTPSEEIANTVVQMLMPTTIADQILTKNKCGVYIGFNIEGLINSAIGFQITDNSSSEVKVSGGGYLYAMRKAYYTANNALALKSNHILGQGMNGSYFGFSAGVEYLWFMVGY